MASLIELTQWEVSIYQLETTDPVVGGNDGLSNRQAKQLANRTAYLKQEVELKAPLASPTFTGVPAVPTAAVDANTTQVASTAFVQAQIAAGHLASKTSNGYQKLPSGLILQWGSISSLVQDDQMASFVIQYPNACFYVGPVCFGNVEYAVGIGAWDKTQFMIEGYASGARAIKWMSIGY